MSDEAESSRAGVRHGNAAADAERDDAIAELNEEEEARQRREQTVKERRVDAKRKRILFLEHMLRELDMLVYLEFITIYHLDCSFFWFVVRAVIHASLLTPIPDLGLARQHDEHKPYLPLILFSFVVNFLLHLLYPAPSAGEDTRGYLHGGLMIDFIGQQGPTSKWKLLGLDTCIMILQTVMVSVHIKRRGLKKKLAKISSGSSASRTSEGESSTAAGGDADGTTNEHAAREQDPDSEERGVLRRTDTLSDIGADPDEEDTLLPTSSTESGHADALDILTSGQCMIGEFTLIDTLLQEHSNYQTYRQTRSETASSTGLSPETLRRLHTIRVRFGVGGG